MKGIECPICHGRCDPGEMIGGVCLECREEERQEEERQEEERQMKKQSLFIMRAEENARLI